MRDAGGNIITLDVPGASATDALGINDAGQIVGGFLRECKSTAPCPRHRHRATSTLPSPALSTEAWGIV